MSRFEHAVRHLLDYGVEFIVIGGQAEALYGSARPTYDTDLCYQRTEANLERLAAALRAIRPTLRGAPPDLPFQIDARSLALGSNFTLDTPFGALDLLGDVEPLGGYEEILRNTKAMPVAGSSVRVIALDDLIRIKEHLGRPKDRDSLMHLRAIKRILDETGQDPAQPGP